MHAELNSPDENFTRHQRVDHIDAIINFSINPLLVKIRKAIIFSPLIKGRLSRAT